MFKKKKKLWIILALFIIIVIVVIIFSGRGQSEEYTTVKATKGPLTQTVFETGTVRPVKEVNLNFLSAGTIEEVSVEVGDEILAGQLLAKLETESLEIRKLEAQAGLLMAQANLSKVLLGVDDRTVEISRRSLDQAKSAEQSAKSELDRLKLSLEESLAQAEKTLYDLQSDDPSNITPQEQVVISAKTSLENTKNTNQKNIDHSINSAIFIFLDKLQIALIAMDNINTILENDDAKHVLSAKNSSWKNKTINSRLIALDLIKEAQEKTNIAQEEKNNDNTSQAAEATQIALSSVRQVLSDAYFMLEATITSSSFPQTSLDSYKSLVNNQISQINLAVSSTESTIQAWQSTNLNYQTAVLSAKENLQQAEVNLNNAINSAVNNVNSLKLSNDQQINSAQSRLNSAISSVLVAEAQLDSTSAPVKQEDINLARAQVSQAEANVASVNKQIEDSNLISPLDGIVTAVNFSVGENFAPGVIPLISILVNNIFEVEVDISESDINKVKIYDEVKITLDSFGDDVIFTGQVYFIEPAQTLIQGVVYYKVKIKFISLENWLAYNEEMRSEIKAGMTANVEITTAFRDEVIKVPSRAIIDQGGGVRMARLLVNEEISEVPVLIGLRGDDGLVEVIEGIEEGDEVVTFIRSN